jgi:hypothetical protein
MISFLLSAENPEHALTNTVPKRAKRISADG